MKYDRDYFKKEEKFSKMKLDDKEWFFKDEIIKVFKDDKSFRRVRDMNKDVSRFFRDEKDRSNKVEKEKLAKEKFFKEEKLRLYKEERKKKFKDRFLKLEKKNDFKEDKILKEKEKIFKEDKEKFKKEKVYREDFVFDDYCNKS